MMKKASVILAITIIIVPAYGSTFESFDSKDYLNIELSEESASGILRIDGRIISFDEDVKFYHNGNFSVKIFSDGKLYLRGIADGDSYNVIVLDLVERKIIATMKIQKLSTEFFEPKPQEHIGMHNVREAQEIQRIEDESNQEVPTVIPRSEYTKGKEIAIMTEMPTRTAIYSFFDFDIRVVDPNINPLYRYSDTMGYINDAEITVRILDSQKEILATFSGNTTDNGVFGIDDKFYLDYGMSSMWPYSIEISATKYFDDTHTVSTSFVDQEFVVYESKESNKSNNPMNTIP